MKDDEKHIDKLSKRNIHKVPVGYFDDLPMRIQQRVAGEDTESAFAWRMRYVWQMSAALVIIILGFIWLYPNSENIDQDILSDVSTEDIVEYLAYEEISDFELSDNFSAEELIFETDSLYLQSIEDGLSEEDLESIYLDYDYSIDVL